MEREWGGGVSSFSVCTKKKLLLVSQKKKREKIKLNYLNLQNEKYSSKD